MKIAIVTGANRGLGRGTAKALSEKGFRLILLGRKRAELEAVKKELGGEKEASVVELDLSNPASIESAASEVKRLAPEGIDLLINNAGVFLEKGGAYDVKKTQETLQINTLGPLQFSMELAPLLKKKKANVVNVSSGMGGLAEMGSGYPAYRLSKAALNAVTRVLSEEWKDSGVKVNSVCPGWVKTDMGGEGAERSIPEGVNSILYAALLEKDGPTGGFFRDGKKLAW